MGIYNEPAIAFYGERGFVRLRVLPHYYWDGSNADLMEKTLGIENHVSLNRNLVPIPKPCNSFAMVANPFTERPAGPDCW